MKSLEPLSNSFIDASTVIEGDLLVNTNLYFDGTLKGSVRGQNEAKIHIGPKASIEGRIEAFDVVVEGRVTGDVFTRNVLEIKSSGSVRGNIEVKSLQMANGGFFEGDCKMIYASSSGS